MRKGGHVELGLFLAAALLLGAGFGFSGRDRPGYELTPKSAEFLRVVTWNVGGGLDQGGAALEDESLAHVARVLNELEPDFVFLQEVRDRVQAEQLENLLDDDWDLETSPGGRVVVGFTRTGRLRERGPRQERLLRVQHDESGIHFCAVHADAFSSRERNAQLGALAAELGDLEEPCLLLGDLNLDLDLGKRRDLFTDDEYLDVETYNFIAQRLVDAGQGTGSTAEPDRRLDYVFVSPRSFEVRSAGPWRSKRGPGMDHDPVVCDLVLR